MDCVGQWVFFGEWFRVAAWGLNLRTKLLALGPIRESNVKYDGCHVCATVDDKVGASPTQNDSSQHGDAGKFAGTWIGRMANFERSRSGRW